MKELAGRVRYVSPEKARGREEVTGLSRFSGGADIPVFLLNIFAKSEKTDLTPKERSILKTVLANIAKTYRSRGVTMKTNKATAGQRMIKSAREALAFAKGKENHGCEVHIPEEIDVKAIRENISLSQAEFARLFGLSKRTLEHWEHGQRVPSGPARAFLIVIAREPDAVRRALLA